MVVLEIVKGDLLNSKPATGIWYIAQQCNCNTKKSRGLSEVISKRWKYADLYRTRQGSGTPGTIVIMEPPHDGPTVLCLMAQWGPSKPGSYSSHYPQTYNDTYVDRKEWFLACLKAMDDLIPPNEVVNIPFQIGCGLAGGKWPEYLKMLESCQTQVRIWQL
jgi:hypothetical protein